MADDTRQSPTAQQQAPREDLSKAALTVDPNQRAFGGEQWKDAKKDYKPAPAANILAGGTENTAGGKLPDVSISNAFEGGLKVSDFTNLPAKPCVRESLLTGFGGGFALGGLRFIFRASLFTACTWFVASSCVASGVMYQYCQYRRHAEREGMMRAVEILNKKEIEKKAREAHKEKQREERRKLKEQELDEQYTKLRTGKDAKSDDGGIAKPWWKVW